MCIEFGKWFAELMAVRAVDHAATSGTLQWGSDLVVNRFVSEPATGVRYRGRTSNEEEYICPQGISPLTGWNKMAERFTGRMFVQDLRRELGGLKMPNITTLSTMIMDAIANDFESLESIYTQVETWAWSEGIRTTREDIVIALLDLLGRGYAKAYLLSPHDPPEITSELDVENIMNSYFLLTNEGRSVLNKSDLQ